MNKTKTQSMSLSSLTPENPLLLVGCGKMGRALAEGWLAQGLAPEALAVVEPNPVAPFPAGVRVMADFDAAIRAGLAVLAIKPQMMDQALPAYREALAKDGFFLSIAAGRTLAYFQAMFGDAPVVRAMPNTPAAIGRGVTVCCANRLVSPAQRDLCGAAVAAVGRHAWLEDEGLMDAVTAVSGSGPAYVFYLVEALAAAGAAAGLPAELAMLLARETVAGSGELLHQSADSAEQLRVNVTSPGGTTAEALKVLMADDGLRPLLDRAVAANIARSRALAAG